MGLVGEWERVATGLPESWAGARVLLELDDASRIDRATALLAPLSPLRAGPRTVAVQVGRHGAGSSAEALRRALGRLDAERLQGTVSADAVELAETETAAVEPVPAPTLAESWDAALASLPADWSDLLGEIELASSDYSEPAAIQLAPINPRLTEDSLHLQFRSASAFGFGASTGMVRRCLERCDALGIRGRVRVLRALSDTHPVGTQGPVWHIGGRMV